MAPRPLRSLFCVVLACTCVPGGAVAAELGEARVVSHIGQQLVADIELNPQDEAAPLQVRLASADVYRGAGIAMPALLSGLNLSVTRRGGRQFVHVTSQGAVQSEYLHLYLELAEGNERAVRLATLWLTPDPNPAPPVAPRPEFRPVPKSEPKPAPAPAPKPAPAPGPRPAPAPKLAQAAVAMPPKPAPKPDPAPRVRPVQRPKPVVPPAVPLQVAKIGPMAAATPPLVGAVKPASCPRPNPAQLKTCVALDYKNAQLKAQIGQLEDKVKVLQLAMGAAPRTATAPQAVKTPAVRLVPYSAKPRDPAPPPEPELPWLWLALGATVLLAGGGAAWVLVRRRKAEQEHKAKAMKATLPPIMGSVKNRLMPGGGAAEGVQTTTNSAEE